MAGESTEPTRRGSAIRGGTSERRSPAGARSEQPRTRARPGARSWARRESGSWVLRGERGSREGLARDGPLQPRKRHEPLPQPELARELVGGSPAHAFHLPGAATRFLDQRGHLHVAQTARDDPAERLKVVLDV